MKTFHLKKLEQAADKTKKNRIIDIISIAV